MNEVLGTGFVLRQQERSLYVLPEETLVDVSMRSELSARIFKALIQGSQCITVNFAVSHENSFT
jgi:hypothetical protein